ncbi:hypothetical protein HMPREF9508_02002 [Enterococcus faecalis TX0312]|nr:hypothetical protein HMPREF9508_02002 [Enterococcus faecalis TX0312]
MGIPPFSIPRINNVIVRINNGVLHNVRDDYSELNRWLVLDYLPEEYQLSYVCLVHQ